MTNTEKRLRDWMMTHAGHAQMKNLDALLAEHRSEVERLEELVEKWKDASGLMVGEDPDGVTPEMLRKDLGQRERECSSARDAALEEAAAYVDGDACDPRRLPERIRALKSSPCAVLPVDKVRKVLREHLSPGVFARVMAALGVDLDAKADVAPLPTVNHHGAVRRLKPDCLNGYGDGPKHCTLEVGHKGPCNHT